MIRTRLAQAAAVATVSLTAIILMSGAAMATEAKTPAPATAEIPDSLGWGVQPSSNSLGWG
ncbi:hypothetical protein ACFZBM_27750 [Streptomyces lavendulae]|uniref:Uncharacterized protein n=1 Tax=Streptomyces lavendulae subsp. lavendulae TaxID=58340 RepID=A0A2K8PD57_STRLA|nr:hypothetical protein SLAV_08470 [Streptomyces lavendulae subsp. lavendulae]QUQ53396.1 hypothetical protein SLLC_06500 [Streptomyces lavendulae subsp. lavendulae]